MFRTKNTRMGIATRVTLGGAAWRQGLALVASAVRDERTRGMLRKARTHLVMVLAAAAVVCASGAISGAIARTTPQPNWQNPYLAPRENNNIHIDSYASDTYTLPGPTGGTFAETIRVDTILYPDGTTIGLGECATQTFDARGHVISFCSGSKQGPHPGKVLVLLDANMKALAARVIPVPDSQGVGNPDPNHTPVWRDFSGGYFYLNQHDHPVIAQPNNHIVEYTPNTGTERAPGYFAPVPGRDFDVSRFITSSGDKLYAVMPDKDGNIWFTTHGGVVGTITLHATADCSQGCHAMQLPDEITKSMAADEGDSRDGPSGVYTPTTSRLYRFEAGPDGRIHIGWSTPYDKGTSQKPGQIALGTGTTPTVFRMAGHRYVTINDNATPMHINIYRAEDHIGNQPRLFAQVAPFGARSKVADENSLIAFRTAAGAAIIAENNWGYRTPLAASFHNTTEPGLARVDVTPGGAKVASVNNHISVPSVVSHVDTTTGLVYTYEKRIDGWWYLTGLDMNDLNHVVFAVRVGKSTPSQPLTYNNNYAELSVGNGDGNVYVGVIGGLVKIAVH
jgi:hypothetical protein